MVASSCPHLVGCIDTVMESWDCLFWSVLLFFSMPVHFSPSSCVCHASSLSPSQLLLPPPFLASSFLRGMEVIDRRPTTCEKKLWKQVTVLVIFLSTQRHVPLAFFYSFSPYPSTRISALVSMSLCASQTCLISRFDQNNWRWPCCQRAWCCIQIGKRST